jgi:hypothetical protein
MLVQLSMQLCRLVDGYVFSVETGLGAWLGELGMPPFATLGHGLRCCHYVLKFPSVITM